MVRFAVIFHFLPHAFLGLSLFPQKKSLKSIYCTMVIRINVLLLNKEDTVSQLDVIQNALLGFPTLGSPNEGGLHHTNL